MMGKNIRVEKEESIHKKKCQEKTNGVWKVGFPDCRTFNLNW